MPKEKLTLYVDEDLSDLAHRIAKSSGKSISGMVEEYFNRRGEDWKDTEVSATISKWVGLLKTKKTYRQLRNEQIASRIKRHEGSG